MLFSKGKMQSDVPQMAKEANGISSVGFVLVTRRLHSRQTTLRSKILYQETESTL
jgi:hypothetical protein